MNLAWMMNLSVSTISVQIDPIFSSTSNEDYTHPLAPPSLSQQKKGTPTKKFESPSLGSLKFGWFCFLGAKGWADKEQFFCTLRSIVGNPQDDIDLSR
jgi:hypothetical protein